MESMGKMTDMLQTDRSARMSSWRRISFGSGYFLQQERCSALSSILNSEDVTAEASGGFGHGF